MLHFLFLLGLNSAKFSFVPLTPSPASARLLLISLSLALVSDLEILVLVYSFGSLIDSRFMLNYLYIFIHLFLFAFCNISLKFDDLSY